MSFYTDNRPRLIESNIYNKIIRKNMIDDFMKKEEQKEIKTTFNFSEYTSYFSEFIKNNWSFLLILSILIIILVYRYNVIKEDQELKKARKQYIDQLIMDNYRKEKRIELEKENNKFLDQINPIPEDIENQELIDETLNEEKIYSEDIYTDKNQDIFSSKLDNTYEAFYGNSRFAPF